MYSETMITGWIDHTFLIEAFDNPVDNRDSYGFVVQTFDATGGVRWEHVDNNTFDTAEMAYCAGVLFVQGILDNEEQLSRRMSKSMGHHDVYMLFGQDDTTEPVAMFFDDHDHMMEFIEACPGNYRCATLDNGVTFDQVSAFEFDTVDLPSRGRVGSW
jgi:hypothetical protein